MKYLNSFLGEKARAGEPRGPTAKTDKTASKSGRPKKLRPFTWKQHESLGLTLSTFRNGTLIEAVAAIDRHYGARSAQWRAVDRALHALDALRSVLDDAACTEHQKPGLRPTDLYYPNVTLR